MQHKNGSFSVYNQLQVYKMQKIVSSTVWRNLWQPLHIGSVLRLTTVFVLRLWSENWTFFRQMCNRIKFLASAVEFLEQHQWVSIIIHTSCKSVFRTLTRVYLFLTKYRGGHAHMFQEGKQIRQQICTKSVKNFALFSAFFFFVCR